MTPTLLPHVRRARDHIDRYYSTALTLEQLAGVAAHPLEPVAVAGEQLAQRSPTDGIVLPPPPAPSTDRRRRAEEATDKIRAFVHRVQAGLPTAEAYRATRAAVIAEDCGGDELVFFAAWNYLLGLADACWPDDPCWWMFAQIDVSMESQGHAQPNSAL